MIEDLYRIEAEALVDAKRKKLWSGKRLTVELPVREVRRK